MAQLSNVLFCAVCATAAWTAVGFPIAARVFGRWHSWLLAPALGWATFNVVALPLCELVGMSRKVILIITLAGILSALLSASLAGATRTIRIPGPVLLGVIAALLVALIPLAGILPKSTPDGITLASPIFDHSKVAMIDEIIRSGVPARNPFFNEVGTQGRVAYYYLWHFSAAAAGIMTGVSGWEADAALTGFTAFASLLLMIGLAIQSGARPWAGLFVVGLAFTASLRPGIEWMWPGAASIIGEGSGFGAWLFQTSWAPQHVASATCVTIACLLIPRLAEQPRRPFAVLLGLVGAAAFQSSVWVGGIVLTLAASAIGLLQLWSLRPEARWPFLKYAVMAATVGACAAMPFVYDQLGAAAMRGNAPLLAFTPAPVLGTAWPGALRRLLDLPAYWLVYLPLEFPAFYPIGLLAIGLPMFGRKREGIVRHSVCTLSLLAAVSLTTAWLAASVIGDNNDLGWRAVLPAIFVLVALASTLISHWPAPGSRPAALFAALGIVLSLPGVIKIARENLLGLRKPSERLFSATPNIWQAVQRHTSVDERVANNPLMLSDMTPWPVNISWALMADRRSCYAGSELAIPFAPISTPRRAAIEALFVRTFSGTPEPDDVKQLAEHFRCDTLLITAQDGAWHHDPFASSELYRLVESNADGWRIYRRSSNP